MKKLASFEKEVGADGGKVMGSMGVEGAELMLELQASYPIAKIIEPACKLVDEMLVKLETAIPGEWDKPLIEKLKEDYKAQLVKMLGE